MTARIIAFTPRPQEPMRISSRRPTNIFPQADGNPAGLYGVSAAWCLLWLLVPVFWGAAAYAVWVRQ